MKITATPISADKLKPGDLYSDYNQGWWDLVGEAELTEPQLIHLCLSVPTVDCIVHRITIGDPVVEPVALASLPSYANDFGGWLKERMKTHGDSVDDLAAHLGRTKGFVSNLRSGQSKPSAEIAGVLAEHYGVDSETFIFYACGYAAELKQILDGFPKASRAVIGS